MVNFVFLNLIQWILFLIKSLIDKIEGIGINLPFTVFYSKCI